jgi:hypothetical protein
MALFTLWARRAGRGFVWLVSHSGASLAERMMDGKPRR